MYTKPTAPRSIGGVLDDSIRLYREGFAKAWPLALAAQALATVPTLIFRLRMSGGGGATPQSMLAMFQAPGFWLAYLLAVIASIGFFNAITLQLSARFHGQVLPAGQALPSGFRLLPRVLLMVLLFALCGTLAALLLYFAFQGSAALRVILSIAAALIVLYLVGRVYLVNIALVADDYAVIKSVETSWVLTRGHWWRGATIYTVIIVIAMVFYLVIGFVTGIIAVALGPKSATGISLAELVSIVGSSLVLPLITAALLCIYYDFKLRNQGADLADRVNALTPR